MSKHSDQFNLSLAIAESLRLCRETLLSLGWQVTGESDTQLMVNEVTNPIVSMTWPANVELDFAFDPAGGTRVVVKGSIFGFGPIQSGHLKEAMRKLRGSIEQAASQAGPAAGRQTIPSNPVGHQSASRSVTINQARLDDDALRLIEQRLQARVPDGSYWYDKISGAWGLEGGPTLGFTLPGLGIGGPLRPDASNGNTGVFINGRQLHLMDVQSLQQITGVVLPGRYWVDAQGNGGYEGGPVLFNLRLLAQQAASRSGGMWRTPGGGVGESYGGGAWAYGNSNTGIGVISDGEGGMMIFDK
jgi:hypothetical protein